jgi:hypothetical protein
MWGRSGTKIHRKKWTPFSGLSLETIRNTAVKNYVILPYLEEVYNMNEQYK